MERENYLAIDWGERKIGLALAHPETGIAVAYSIIENNDKVFENLKKIIFAEGVGQVVVGLPQYQRKVEHPAQDFGNKIKQFGVQVVFWNELFTTKMAQESLVSQGYRHVSQSDDAEAAKILLQGWLDQRG